MNGRLVSFDALHQILENLPADIEDDPEGKSFVTCGPEIEAFADCPDYVFVPVAACAVVRGFPVPLFPLLDSVPVPLRLGLPEPLALAS